MRKSPALLLLASVVCLAGCAVGADKELQTLVEDVAPTERELVGCEWQKNWGSGPDSVYGCTYTVVGLPKRTSWIVVTNLEARGFRVVCASNPMGIELMAVRDGTTVYGAFQSASFANSSRPGGAVVLQLGAVKGGEQPVLAAGGDCPRV